MEHNIFFVLMLSSSCLGWIYSLYSSFEGGLVERMFFCYCARYPFRLASIYGKSLVIKLVVSPVNVSRLLDLITRRRVEGRGLNSVPDRYLAKSCFVFWVLKTPLAWCVFVMAGGGGGVLVGILLMIFAWLISVMSAGGGGGGGGGGWGVSGTSQRPFTLRLPMMMIVLF